MFCCFCCFFNFCLLTRGEIVAGTAVEAEPLGIGVEIGLGVKIVCICRYVFEDIIDMFTPRCGVLLQTIIDLNGDLLSTITRLASDLFGYKTVPTGDADTTDNNVFINELSCSSGGEIINGYFNGYFGGLSATVVVAAVEGIRGLTTAKLNRFLYGFSGYFNRFNIERKRRIVFSSGVPSVASHNIVLEFFDKEKE